MLFLAALVLSLGIIEARRGRRPRRSVSSSSSSSSATRYDTSDTTMNSWAMDLMKKKNYLRGGHQVPLMADVGFYAFEFGKRMEPIRTTFHFILTRTAYLSVTDCFCEGDSFQVTDNGGSTFLTNNNCPTGPLTCRNYESDPWKCLNEKRFCSGGAFMLPGAHNVSIVTTSSVAGGGTAFLRLDTMCEDPTTRQLYFCCLTGDQCVKGIFSS